MVQDKFTGDDTLGTSVISQKEIQDVLTQSARGSHREVVLRFVAGGLVGSGSKDEKEVHRRFLPISASFTSQPRGIFP